MQISEFISANNFNTSTINTAVVQEIKQQLSENGYAVLRDFSSSISSFSMLINDLCDKVTFDPAREYSSKNTQKVDSGIDPIGLHIENGNTPFSPDVVAFYCKRSAKKGSRTTVCDGSQVYQALSDNLKELFSQTLTVSRNLSEQLWKQYAVNEHPAITSIDDVKPTHLEQILAIAPNHRCQLNNDGSLFYELDIAPLLNSKFSNKTSFANAVLGPSFNYEPPRYVFSNGVEITPDLKQELAEIAENYTYEMPWQDGDILIIDNRRVMHGRRAIEDAENREIYIGMGSMH